MKSSEDKFLEETREALEILYKGLEKNPNNKATERLIQLHNNNFLFTIDALQKLNSMSEEISLLYIELRKYKIELLTLSIRKEKV